MNHFFELYESGSIKRWHTAHTIKEQDVAAHSWGVAMICEFIRPGDHKLVMAALTHDTAEAETGDVPFQVKYNHPSIAKAVSEVEFMYDKYHDIIWDLTPVQQKCLKWADMFELYLWATREVSLGNAYMVRVRNGAEEILNEMRPPTELAQQLWIRKEMAWNPLRNSTTRVSTQPQVLGETTTGDGTQTTRTTGFALPAAGDNVV